MSVYQKSLKSQVSDELINTYLVRPLAGVLVKGLYSTSVTPNQVTWASIVVGLIAAIFYLPGTPVSCFTAGLLITLKDLLDSADGQLARAKQQYSRAGRFLDSLGDFIVNVGVFSAIGWMLYRISGQWTMFLLAILGLLGISFRVSYHVFYQVKFLHIQKLYLHNRVSEEIREEDVNQGGPELILQRLFLFVYGWQDRMVLQIDLWCRNRITRTSSYEDAMNESWYSDSIGLRLSGFIGLGTELFVLMLCSLFNTLELYLYLNLFAMNGILVLCILYRRIFLTRVLRNRESR